MIGTIIDHLDNDCVENLTLDFSHLQNQQQMSLLESGQNKADNRKKYNILHSGIGAVTINDIEMARASKGCFLCLLH
jgi:hypothetical protein